MEWSEPTAGSTTNTSGNTATELSPVARVGPGGVRSALRKLVGASAVYGLGSVLVRGLAFVLIPLYTRYLSPAEYGIVALTVTCTVVLRLLYPLGLRGAVSRTYYESGSAQERKERVGTLW